jgi:hypothetical protein
MKEILFSSTFNVKQTCTLTVGLGLWCLMPLSTIFQLYRGSTLTHSSILLFLSVSLVIFLKKKVLYKKNLNIYPVNYHIFAINLPIKSFMINAYLVTTTNV